MDDPPGRDWKSDPLVITAIVGAVATAVSAVFGLVLGIYNFSGDRADDRHDRANDAREARHDVIADVLQMGELDAEGGASSEREILVLAADAGRLMEDFTPDELRLSPVVYRLMAEYVAYSTREVEVAAELADRVLDVADPDSRERIFAQRVLGHLAAQRVDPAEFESRYDTALALNDVYGERKPHDAKQVETFTRAYRLLSAYLGARLSKKEPAMQAAHQEFCDLAQRWGSDLDHIRQLPSNRRVLDQLGRLRVTDVDGLAGLCA